MQQLITREQLLERTPINGNVDTNKLVPSIITSQDIEVQTVLGTPLYKKLLADVSGAGPAGDYLTLYADYVVPMACHYAAAEFYLFHAFEISNGGVFRHQTDSSFTPDMADVLKLSTEQRNRGKHYQSRLVDYLTYYSSLFPEYTQNAEAGMSPNSSTPPNQWNFN